MDRKVGDNGVIDAGWVAIRKGKIAAVGAAADALPDGFGNAVAVDTGGTLYPGLMDLHNHLAYNVLPLWKVPRKYTNRGQWPRHAEYAPNVQLPINLLGAYAPTARSIVRYIECKALVGGTTAAQGVRSKQSKMTKLYRGAMRNLEETDDKRLPEAGSKVLNYKRGDPKDTEAFKSALAKYRAYFYHLSEGTDNEALSHFTDLVQNDLLGPALVGIHSLGLTPANLAALGARGGKIVWSPYSNMLLYGQTLDLQALRASGTQFTIGCDWAPTGSKNLLQELKVARFESQRQGNPFSSEELVRAVTTSAAQVLGWDPFLGTLKAGALADRVVIDGTAGDPYDLLIDATETDVRLVTVHGTPRYGDADLMKQLHTDPAHPPEPATIGGKEKAFALFAANAPLNDLTLANATAILTDAMGDMRGFEQRMKEDTAHLLSFGMEADEGFVLELDNEFDPRAETPTAVEAGAEVDTGPELLGGEPKQVAEKVDLDQIEVNTEEYWARVDAQDNISAELKEMLKHAYQ
jgi:5-methylthioadenosine/S-adenosylhomocysteine deaminase